MTRQELDELVTEIRLPGWHFTTDGWEVHVSITDPPPDARTDGVFDGLADSFIVYPDWDRDRIINRVFCHLQFLVDHELREHFTLDGRCVFDPHHPTVTGQQHDWFVEHQSALAGY